MKRVRFVELGRAQTIASMVDKDLLSIETAIDACIRDSLGAFWRVVGVVVSATPLSSILTLAQLRCWAEFQLELRFKQLIPVLLLTNSVEPDEVNAAKRRFSVDPDRAQLVIPAGGGFCRAAFRNACIEDVLVLT